MDKYLEITPIPIASDIQSADGCYSRTYMAVAPTGEIRSLRGNLFLCATFRVFKELDLVRFGDSVLSRFSQKYFSNLEGGITEVLEEETGVLAEEVKREGTELNLSAVVIWGEVMIAKVLGSGKVFLAEKNETLEFFEGAVHQEALGAESRIILTSVPKGEEVQKEELKIFLESSNLPEVAAKFKETLMQSEKATHLAILLLSVKEGEVPSEEERIEIEETPAGPSQNIWGRVWLFIKDKTKEIFWKIADFFKNFWLKRKPDQPPAIYLKNHFASGKSVKVLLAVALSFLLLGAIAVTKRINENSLQNRLAKELLTKASENIAAGKTLASLNSEKAGELLNEARLNLDKVKGVNIQKPQVSKLQGELDQAYLVLYKTSVVKAQTTAKTYPGNSLSIDTRNGVVQTTKEGNIVLIKPDVVWQKITDVKEYLSNIYLLDLGSQKIWKYLALGGGFSSALSYFKDNVDLTNVLDWAIDGSVYLLRPDGLVEKYLAGKLQDFNMSGFYPSVKDARLIFATLETENLYLGDDNSILVFGKDGVYKREIRVSGIGKIDAFYVNEKENYALIKDGGSVLEAVLPKD